MTRTVVTLIAALALSACSTYKAEWQHISHPFAGPPFGPTSEEDSLDHIQVCGVRRYAFNQWTQAYAESCVGYVLADGGFYGPNLTGGVRVGIEIGRDK